MRSPDQRAFSVPTCIRCDTYLVKHSVETVTGQDGSTIRVQVYECPSCEKFSAQEIASNATDEAA